MNGHMVAIMRGFLAIGRAVGVDADVGPEARMDMARTAGVAARFTESLAGLARLRAESTGQH